MLKLNSAEYLRKIINEAEKSFPSGNILSRRREAERIISHVLKISSIDIYTNSNITILESQKNLLSSFIERRINREPLQYILGEEYFRELTLSVGPGVLIPRPETAQLVETALKLLPSQNAKILDVGTGCGTVALSIAHEAQETFVTGVDISEEALKFASKNMLANKISNVRFVQSSLCDSFADCSFDIITANLPYVTEKEFTELDLEIRNFEPKEALIGGYDGLDLIRRLIPRAFCILKPSGWLLLEIGYRQGIETVELLKANNFYNVKIIQDFSKKDRIAIGQKKFE
jgi:release factor glutamine methyltransferase